MLRNLLLLAALPLTLAASPLLAQSLLELETEGEAPTSAIYQETVGDLLAMEAYGSEGGEIDVEAIARDGNSVVALISVGGLLGFGGHDVAVPIEEFSVDDGRLVLTTHPDSRLKTLMPVDDDQYEVLADDVRIGDVAGAT